MVASPSEPPIRSRAAKACCRCNEKRVKCDALERGTPCTRCLQKNLTDCVLIQSKRGIYNRKRRLQGGSENRVEGELHEGNSRSQRSRSKSHSSPYEGQTQSALQPYLASITSNPAARNTVSPPPRRQNTDLIHLHGDHIEEEGISDNLDTTGDIGRDASQSGASDTSHASYRELSWTTMFDHFLDGQQKGQDMIEKCSITYLGESFPLAIVLKDFRGSVHHPGPPCLENDSRTEQRSLEHPSCMKPEDIIYLDAKKAFEAPDQKTLDALIRVFLDRVFPLYPIVNRQEFIEQYQTKRLPWILLHALCFLSATYCPLSVIHGAQFESRRQARLSYYSKAKALFDLGYEGNKVVILQVSILMSFWGGGPNNYWNFYSWISTGVTIAEALGFHRSMAKANMQPQDRSLAKRLWWILVVRDASCAALVGRPFRINLQHCDVDPLTEADFEQDSQCSDFAVSPYRNLFGLYQMQITKLTLILRQIITARFYPQKRDIALSTLRDMLAEWRSQLPCLLQWSDNISQSNVFTTCLSVVYNHHLILSHLNCLPDLNSEGSPQGSLPRQQSSEDLVNTAAQNIISTASDMVTKSDVYLMPHELFHGIFLAEVVFYTMTKSSQSTLAQLGRSGVRNCQMALHESRDFWDPSPWIMQLFDKLMWTATGENGPDGIHEPHSRISGLEHIPDVFSGVEGLDGAFPSEYDLWHSHPVLGNLFDLPFDGSVMTSNVGEGPRYTPCYGYQADYQMP